MFIITAKVRKGRIAAVAAASAAVSPKGVRTNEDRIAYLESYGWSVSSDLSLIHI